MSEHRINIDFDMKFDDISDLNPSFASARVAIAYPGRNRNYSDISKEVFEAALPSLANCPIVGRYDEEAQDFGGHDIRVKVDDDDNISIETATVPFGVVPETMDAAWVDVTEADGTVRPYLYCNAILWKRQPGYECLAAQGTWHQSMEISVNSYVIDKDGYCVIEDMTFEALTILGRSVEPCFESASVQLATPQAVSNYKAQFSMMMSELRHYRLLGSKGGEIGLTDEKKNEILTKFGLTTEDIAFDVEGMSEDEFTTKVSELAVDKQGTVESFSATYRQKREAISNALEPVVTRDSAGKLLSEVYYYVEDFDDTHVFVERYTYTADDTETKYGRMSYTFDVASNTATITGEFEEMVLQWLTLEENAELEQSRNAFELLQTEFEDYKKDHEHTNTEFNELHQFKVDTLAEYHKAMVDEVLEQFSCLFENDEFKALLEHAYDFEDMDELRKECYAIKGKLDMANPKFNKRPQSVVRVGVPDNAEPPADLYGGLFAVYGPKH